MRRPFVRWQQEGCSIPLVFGSCPGYVENKFHVGNFAITLVCRYSFAIYDVDKNYRAIRNIVYCRKIYMILREKLKFIKYADFIRRVLKVF